MGAYRIRYSKGFKKDFRKLDSTLQKKCLLKLKKLEENPFENSKKLKATELGQFRVRIGDYRMRYDVVDDICIP